MTPPDAEQSAVRRILVVLHTSPQSLEALRAAVELAAALEAEVTGLFVEEVDLLTCADLPITREVGLASAVPRSYDRRDTELQLQAQARLLAGLLARAAETARVNWTFRVARGRLAAEVLAAAAEADIVTIGRAGWAPAGLRTGAAAGWSLVPPGPMRRTLATPAPAEGGSRAGTPDARPAARPAGARALRAPVAFRAAPSRLAVCVLYDGTPTARRALAVAARLLPSAAAPLRVLVAPPGGSRRVEGPAPAVAPGAVGTVDAGRADADARAAELVREATTWMAGRGLGGSVHRLPGADLTTVSAALRALGGGKLVLPATHALASDGGLEALVRSGPCPVVLVR